jgi:hypothetical protein
MILRYWAVAIKDVHSPYVLLFVTFNKSLKPETKISILNRGCGDSCTKTFR